MGSIHLTDRRRTGGFRRLIQGACGKSHGGSKWKGDHGKGQRGHGHGGLCGQQDLRGRR